MAEAYEQSKQRILALSGYLIAHDEYWEDAKALKAIIERIMDEEESLHPLQIE